MPFLDKRPSRGNKGFKLTPKMRSFIDEYMVDMNATQAVIRSDYSTQTIYLANRMASELLAHPLIKEEIQRRLDRKSQKVEVRAEYLIQKLFNIIEDTEKDNPQAALRAIELAGKSIALWKERQEISGVDGEAIKHEQHIKESVADFASRLSSLSQRAGTSGTTIIPFPGTASRTAVDVEVLGETQSDSSASG